eukprot:TRINITY_DN71369_c0_g1_i1.p1 TRINITY_DN71369_c0_g1~~TRINITY_DN71369_c0_g1_i1.p1  ORF type:complete len:439 (-),score=41.14 TRINITY_DN71369_c0_g1_i1:191-1507(-)
MGCSGSTIKHSARERFCDDYDLGEKLGAGGFGQVRLATSRSGCERYAIKISVVGKERQKPDPQHVSACKKEYEMCSRMGRHPNCVQIFDCLQEDHLFYMVMELCEMSLMDYFENQPEDFQDNLTPMLREMLQGIAHCNDMGVVHRDVKPENFLLGGPEGRTIKLCDFGMAVALPKSGFLSGVVGTAPYMAPEVVSGDTYNSNVDVWSFGAVAYLMLFGRFPYDPKVRSPSEMKRAIILNHPKPVFENHERGNFTKALLERSKTRRCSAHEALQMRLLKPQSQCALKPKCEAALVRAATREFNARVDPILQRNLDDLVERLQLKVGRVSSAASGSTSFVCFSERDDHLGKTLAETQPAHRLRKQNTYSGFIDCSSVTDTAQCGKLSPQPSLSCISTKDSLPFLNGEEFDHCKSDEMSDALSDLDEESDTWNPALWSVDD